MMEFPEKLRMLFEDISSIYKPHRHPSNNTAYDPSTESIGASIFDEISIFASLSNLLL